MSRIVSFGCSHTYGHGLDDCLIDLKYPGPHPSQYAWPSLIEKSLNLEVVNKGEPGASNLQILYNILNFEFKNTDIVIVLWSYFGRDCIFNETNNLTKILPSGKTLSSVYLKNLFYKIHTPFDLMTKTLLHMHHAENYFRASKIRYLGFCVEDTYIKFNVPSYLKINNFYDISYQETVNSYERAKDNVHPGVEAQQNISKKIMEFL